MTHKKNAPRTAAYRSYSAISVSPPSLFFFQSAKNKTRAPAALSFLPKGGGFHPFFGGGCASSQKNDRLGLFIVIVATRVFSLFYAFFSFLCLPPLRGRSPPKRPEKNIYISAKYNISQKKS
jgi:hypothetical protein